MLPGPRDAVAIAAEDPDCATQPRRPVPPQLPEVEREERDEEDLDGEEYKKKLSFCIYVWLLKEYGHKLHNLISLGC